MSDGEPDTREALIEAMARCCAERGYPETEVSDLLEATGLRLEEFERQFDGREACAVAAVEAALYEGIATVSGAFSGDTSDAESTLTALLGLLELFADRPHIGSMALIDSRQRMPRAAFERYAEGFTILIAMLDRLRSDGPRGAEAPASAARAGLGGAEAVIRRELAAGRAATLPGLLPDLIYSAAVPFLGQEEALRLTRQARGLTMRTS